MRNLTLLILTTVCLATTCPAEEEKTKLYEPYAPKASGASPSGWEIQMLKGSNIETKTTLKNGREIKVNAPAYELVPQAGGITIKDPGFDPKLANSQKNTIGALLTAYSETAGNLQTELEKTLGELEKALQIGSKPLSQQPTQAQVASAPAAAPTQEPSPAPTKEQRNGRKK